MVLLQKVSYRSEGKQLVSRANFEFLNASRVALLECLVPTMGFCYPSTTLRTLETGRPPFDARGFDRCVKVELSPARSDERSSAAMDEQKKAPPRLARRNRQRN